MDNIIHELKYVEKMSQNKTYSTGEIRIGDLARDCRIAIEERDKRIKELEEIIEINKKLIDLMDYRVDGRG